MYRVFYKLSAAPFGPSRDPRAFFASSQHRRALAYLRYGLSHDEGSVIVTGSHGTGKTTLLGRLRRDLSSRSLVVAYLTVPPGGVTDLLADAAADLGLPAEDLPPDQLASGVRGHLSTLRQAGKRAYLVVDDVHNLSAGGLRDLQSLLVARYGSRFLLPGLLLGEPGFRETLRDSEYRPLRHATSVAYQLNPLGLEETMAYVEHRLRVAGWQGDPRWLPLAHMEVYFLSFGIPGRVDQLCERVLAHAAELGLHEIKAETVSTAAALLPPEPEPVLESPW